ncbi:MAG: 30S ribosomal protein S11 [bacterium]
MARRVTKKRVPAHCIAHVNTSFNNTLITVADPTGAVVSWSSAGRVGFKGAKKGTPYAAGVCAEAAAKEAVAMGVRRLDVVVCGPGPGREAAVRSLQNAGLAIATIKDITPIPHNGCKPPKQRRV